MALCGSSRRTWAVLASHERLWLAQFHRSSLLATPSSRVSPPPTRHHNDTSTFSPSSSSPPDPVRSPPATPLSLSSSAAARLARRSPLTVKIAQTAAWLLGYKLENAAAVSASDQYYHLCADRWRADPFWLQECALPPTFQTWFQVTLLHAYLLTVRFRALPMPLGRTYTQELVNQVFLDGEERMKGAYNVHQGSLIQGYMRDMLHQYHGGVTALDQGIVASDAVLAAAIWRNLFGAGWGVIGGVEGTGKKHMEGMTTGRQEPDGAEEKTLREAEFAVVLERIVVWMRKEVSRLDGLSDDAVMLAKGEGAEHPAGFLPI